MKIVYAREELADYLSREAAPPRQHLPRRFLEDAIEVDVDASATAPTSIGGVMQHIEEAGVHSGDSACVLPPHSLGEEMLEQIAHRRARDRAGARRRRADERAVRGQRRRAVRARGQPARVAHGPVRVQGDRPAAGEARLPHHGRRAHRRARPAAARREHGLRRSRLGQGGRAAVRSLRGLRRHARPGDALDRRGDGHRARLPDRVRQGAGRRRRAAAAARAPRSSPSPTPTRPAPSPSPRSCTTTAFGSSPRAAPPRRSRAWACR